MRGTFVQDKTTDVHSLSEENALRTLSPDSLSSY